MRLASLAVIMAIVFAACAGEPAGPEATTKTVDVSGIPTRIRMLVAPSRSYFYVDNGTYQGETVHLADRFEQWLNSHSKSGAFDIEFIETPQEALVGDLLAGKGDIAANVMLTFERDEQVAFTTVARTGIRELVVTGPNEKPLVSLEDIGNRTIHVRKASDHYTSLLRLNDQLTKINRPPARIVISDAPTDEDLLEMVNAGTIPATLYDDDTFDAWRHKFDKITANRDVAVSQDGVRAWVTRKDAARLLQLLNEFSAIRVEGN